MKDITEKIDEVIATLRVVREEYLLDGNIHGARLMDREIAKLEEIRMHTIACEEVIKQT